MTKKSKSSYFLSIKGRDGKGVHYKVPREVSVYVKQKECEIRKLEDFKKKTKAFFSLVLLKR